MEGAPRTRTRATNWLPTSAPGAATPITSLRSARDARALEAHTPLRAGAWREKIVRLGLSTKHGDIPNQIQFGFRLGSRTITTEYITNNYPSATTFAGVLAAEIQKEIDAGQYLGPFTAAEVRDVLGPFQVSPISIIKKPGKPGRYRIIRDMSAPNPPQHGIASINSDLRASDHPHSWATFWCLVCTLATLPEGSEAACEDIIEAYRSIGIDPRNWAALVVRAPGNDRFCVDTSLCFGAVPGDGLFGKTTDAFLDIACALGMGPVLPWVDDTMWIRILRCHLAAYNEHRARACERILKLGGICSRGARMWYNGNATPSGQVKEFAEDHRFPLRDLSGKPGPQSEDNKQFTYAACDFLELAEDLGVRYSREKQQLFAAHVIFTGLRWDLGARTVGLPEEKRKKYFSALEALATRPSLREVESVYGKLQHATLVRPEGRAYLADLGLDKDRYNGDERSCRHLSHSTRRELEWWKTLLSQPLPARRLPYAAEVQDCRAYSDASSKVGVSVWIDGWWRAWRLRPGWDTDKRDIAWAEAVGFWLLLRAVIRAGARDQHILLWGDNRVVVEGWWSGCSRNSAVNAIFKRVHQTAADAELSIHSQYVPSADNPADEPSRGVYESKNRLLPREDELGDLSQWLVDFDHVNADKLCLPITRAIPKPLYERDYTRKVKHDEYDTWDAIELERVLRPCTEPSTA